MYENLVPSQSVDGWETVLPDGLVWAWALLACFSQPDACPSLEDQDVALSVD